MAHLPLFARAAQVYVLGADVLDGHYSIDRSKRRIQFARLAERAGAAVSIVSYSLNANPEFAVIDEWRRLPASVRLVSRDSKSAARTTKFLGREAVLGADLAFLAANGMQASTSSVLRGSLCLVPNSSLSAWCGGYENLVEIHARAVQALLESPIVTSVKMMPHDLRNPETTGDVALCTAIIQRLEGAPKSLTMEVPRDALHARAILSSAEVVLTARMG